MEGLSILLFFTLRTGIHIHVRDANGQAKFWIEPEVALENNYGLKEEELGEILDFIRKRKLEIIDAWHKHFSD
jgi:hypothetical protein